jgi:hypothetical protein
VRCLAGSKCTLLGHDEELLEHVKIHDTGNGRLHEEGAVQSFFAVSAKHVHLWFVTNMLQEDKWIFAAPDPAVVTDVKCALITENYRVQKSL